MYTMCSLRILPTIRSLLAERNKALKGTKRRRSHYIHINERLHGGLRKSMCVSLNIVRPAAASSTMFEPKESPPGLFQHLHRERLKTCRSSTMQCLKGAIHTHLSAHTACIWIIRHKRVKITPNSFNRWSIFSIMLCTNRS